MELPDSVFGAAYEALAEEIRHNPLLWLLAFVPVLFALTSLKPQAHTLLFVLSVLAIVPLAALLSHATESVAAKTGDTDRRPAQRHAGKPDRTASSRWLRCAPGNISW